MQLFQSGKNNHAKTSSSRKEDGHGLDYQSITLRRSVQATSQVASTLAKEILVDRLSAKPIRAGLPLALSATATAVRKRTCQPSTVTSQCTTTGLTVSYNHFTPKKIKFSFRIYCRVRRLDSRRLWGSRDQSEFPCSCSNHTRCWNRRGLARRSTCHFRYKFVNQICYENDCRFFPLFKI